MQALARLWNLQITDTTYLTKHSLDKNHLIGFNGEVISSDENRYLYKTNLSGLPGQSGSPLFRVTDDNNLEFTTFASVNSKMNYPNLEKTIQDTINKENQNSK